MDHYIDIQLRPDPEFSPPLLMNVLFGKLHHALADGGRTDIGVSFPQTSMKRPALGDRLRLHGTEATLTALMAHDWLAGLRDHVTVSATLRVPAHASHCIVRRVQSKSSVQRLRRRQARRHGYSEAEAQERVPDHVQRRLELPFVTLRSTSTGQTFRVFIEHGQIEPQPRAGAFSSYGLSTTATVPCF